MGNYGYIAISILRIYRRYIDWYFDIKYRDVKINENYENIKKNFKKLYKM